MPKLDSESQQRVFQDFKVGRHGLVIDADIPGNIRVIENLAVALRCHLEETAKWIKPLNQMLAPDLLAEVGPRVGPQEFTAVGIVTESDGGWQRAEPQTLRQIERSAQFTAVERKEVMNECPSPAR